jgi:DHA1 family bicyclomycin/chloramphenicol resistance-like MFS transporter
MAQRAMSHVMLVFAAAPALAPVIGGWLESLFGWRSVFLFLALFGLFAVVLVFSGLPETHPQAARHSIHPRSVGANYLRVLRHGRFLTLVAALSLGFGGLFLYISGSPALIYDHLGLGEGDFGLFFIPAVAGMMMGSWLSGRIAHSWPPLKILKLGFAVLAVAFIANLLDALWSTPGLFSVVAPLVVYAFGVTLVIPVLTVQALDCFPHNRGMASAVQSFAQMSFNAVVAGFLMPLTASSLVYMALAQGLLLCASVLIMWKTSVRPHVH